MGILSMITSNCVQDAVYWGSPNPDGYGGILFADAVQLKCRWEDKEQLIRLDDGTEISSRAIVYVLQDVDVEGKMYLGTLDELITADNNSITGDNSSATADLLYDADKSYIIKKFEKSPTLGSTTEFIRKVWLTPLLT